MAQLIGARAYVDLPPVPVAEGGVLNTVRVIPTTGHPLMGAEYETLACSQSHDWLDGLCLNVDSPPKLFDVEPTLVEGDPFVVYAGVDCELSSTAENEERVRRAFAYAERRQVDFNIGRIFENIAETIVTGGPPPQGVIDAIGLAEDAIARRYGGQGVIYIPVVLLPQACQNGAVAATLDGRLMTCQGTPVANIVTHNNAIQTIWVSGFATLLQGPIVVHSAPNHFACDGDMSPPRALAERIYVPLFECAVGGVTFVE